MKADTIPRAEKHELHIYMDIQQFSKLKRRAETEHRSLNGQILLYIERGMQQDEHK